MAKSRTSIVTPYIDIITEWLEEDQKHWSKQRHTAKRIHERLQEEYGFTGSYDSVQKFVHAQNPDRYPNQRNTRTRLGARLRTG